ncbi:MAG: hypothetical protein K2M65_06025 [Muribaculaceae bacterium]|nr:hypothetical protein [Muribaculaceae bacterium]
MKKGNIVVSIFVALAIAGVANACHARSKVDVQIDSLVNSHQIMFFGDGDKPSADSVSSLIRSFYYDQFRHFQDPLAPYFLFMSKDANLAMGVGGCVRLRGWYDWGGSIGIPGFAPYAISMNPASRRWLGTTPAGTSLFYRIIGRSKQFGDYQLYIEANFNGYQSRDFHLKKAYAMINDWTIGYASSTFGDAGALPPTVDAQGPNVKMSASAILVRWMRTFKKGWSLAASLEAPGEAIGYDGVNTGQCDQYVPDFAVFGQWEWARGQHIRLAGIVRTLAYKDLLTSTQHSVTGWGLQLSTVFHANETITLYGCVNGGKGYAGLGGDWLVGRYDLVGNPDTPGRMYAPGAWGGYGAFQYNFKPNLFASVTVSGARYCPERHTDPNEYKSGLYGAVNAFWNLTARIQIGAEFNIGRRQNFDGQHHWARRVGAMAQFSF